MPSSALPALTPANYVNRELSWIAFNRRVLAQARDEALPILERIKFLAIVSSNLDEFFMVRVAAVHNKIKSGSPTTRPDGMPPPLLMERIRAEAVQMLNQQRTLIHELLAKLAEAGVRIEQVGHLTAPQRAAMRAYFSEEVFPILTPLAVDHVRPFPFISNLSLNLAVALRHTGVDDEEFVRLKIPDTMPRLIRVDEIVRRYGRPEITPSHDTFVWVEDLISEHLDLLFPGMEVTEHVPFRVTRNADIDFENERDEPIADMGEFMEESLRERRFGTIVRLTVPEGISQSVLQRLIRRLEVDAARDVYVINGALGASSLFGLMGVDRPDLKLPSFKPQIPHGLLEEGNIFDAIGKRDWLVHHPYDSFSTVEAFFQQAAHDPNVLAIKTTLYRVGRNSPIVQALMDARDQDKQVSVLVELKARFDEENNLSWARVLDQKGVHVIYGVEELPIKTHAKISLVVRREGDGVRRYVHLSTGNYNSSTARLYTDIGLFTCDREIADDASRLFNRLTGYAPATDYKHLLVAPEYLHNRLLNLIDGEIEAAEAGKPARLIFKMNQLEEDVVIQKLYQASQAGVEIDLIVRGLCCLRPGLPGMSENIRVISIVGRFLEHSRIFYFHNAPLAQRIYLGSADLMRRNLYHRVEVVFPVLDESLQAELLRILATELRDNVNAWQLQPDDSYRELQPESGGEAIDSHQIFIGDSRGLHALP